MIDIKKLTIGEIATVEDLSGQPITAFGDDDRPKGNFMAALAMIAKRRNGDPAFTFNQALALTMDEINELLGMGEEGGSEDPTEPAATPSRKTQPKS